MGDDDKNKIGFTFATSPGPSLLVRRRQSFNVTENSDTLIDISLFYNHHWELEGWANGLIAGFHYNRMSGVTNDRNSSRDAGSLFLGWRLDIARYFLFEIQTGLGVASNRLNFGGGFEPRQEISLNFSFQAKVGMQACFNNGLCLTPFVGFIDEEIIHGQPEYYVRGPILGVDLTWLIPHTPEIKPIVDPTPPIPLPEKKFDDLSGEFYPFSDDLLGRTRETLGPKLESTCERIKRQLESNPTLRLSLSGHADDPKVLNERLWAIQAYFWEQGLGDRVVIRNHQNLPLTTSSGEKRNFLQLTLQRPKEAR